MAVEIRLPALLPGMTQARLVRWHVGEGSEIAFGDVLAEIDTGRAHLEIEATEAGVIERLLVAPGETTLPVHTPIALLGSNAPEARPAPLPTHREVLNRALAEEMRRDPQVVVFGTAVGERGGHFGITEGLLGEFGPERVVEGASETALIALAVGAGLAGMRPVVEVRSLGLALSALEPVIQTAAKTRFLSGGRLDCPIVLRGPDGGGPRSAAQHGQSVAAWLASVPGLKLAAPCAGEDAGGLLRAAIRDPDPVVLIEHETLYATPCTAPPTSEPLALGQAHLKRPGETITLASYGIGTRVALEAAARLAREGIEAEVLDLRSLAPLDSATVAGSVRKTGRCVVIEPGPGGIGEHLATALMAEVFDALKAPILVCGDAATPVPYAEALERRARIDAETVAATAQRLCARDHQTESVEKPAPGIGTASTLVLRTTVDLALLCAWCEGASAPPSLAACVQRAVEQGAPDVAVRVLESDGVVSFDGALGAGGAAALAIVVPKTPAPGQSAALSLTADPASLDPEAGAAILQRITALLQDPQRLLG